MSDYLEYFDFDAFSGTDEYTFDFNCLSDPPLIGQDEQTAAPDLDFSLLPDTTAALVEPCSPRETPAPAALLVATPIGALQLVGAGVAPCMHTKVETSPYHSTAIEDSSAVTVQPNLNQYDLDTRGHYPVQRTGFSCVECNRSFPNQTALNEHGERGKHGCVACSCGAKFARQDVLNRHCTSFRKDASKFPCKFCKRHRGNRAFRRRDHLVQHLQGYHKFDSEEILKICPKYRTSYAPHHLICPDPSCESSLPKKVGRVRSDTLFPFKKQSDYNKHLRDVHKLTPFPCPVAECERVGAKGYVAENGLMKHLANQHPDAPQHLAIFREQLQGGDIVCDRCGKGLSLVEFNIHCRLAH